MEEFWEKSFREKQEMWGFESTHSAAAALALFRENNLQKILIPGFGYGRNARLFIDDGFDVTGIEISETAIALAKKHYGENLKIYHGSVVDMPFDHELYDGIFCYALIHLLNSRERVKLISDCFSQLQQGGYMVFVAVSKDYPTYGKGRQLSRDRFETMPGVNLYFYDSDTIRKDFGKYGLVDFVRIDEAANSTDHKLSLKFWYIVCRK